MIDTQSQIQEDQYEFPYHHLVEKQGGFSQSKVLFWGYEYMSYLGHVIEAISRLSFESIADVGCGDGKLVRETLDAFPNKRIVGIDYSEHAIQFARAFNPSGTFIISDLLSNSDPLLHDSFDIATLIEVVEHIPPADARRFIEAVADILHPNGRLIITVPSDNVPRNPKHYRHFNQHIIKELLGGIFEIEQIEYLNKKSPWNAVLQRLLSNRFFILNYPPLLCYLYDRYERTSLRATEQNGKRMFVVARKKT